MSCGSVSDKLPCGFCKNDCTLANSKWYAVALIVVGLVVVGGGIFFGVLNVIPASSLPQGLAFIATQLGHGGCLALEIVGCAVGGVGFIGGGIWFFASKCTAPPDVTEHETPLHRAARMGNVVEIEHLLATGHDIEEKDREGKTPLFTAIFYDNPKTMQALLDKGASREATINGSQADPLFFAVINNAGQAIKILVKKYGMDINKLYGLKSLSRWAIELGQLKALEALLANGVDLSDDLGVAILNYADRTNKTGAAHVLRRFGVGTERG